jgi:hypothetical protein
MVRAHKGLAAPTARRPVPFRLRAPTSRIVRRGRAVRRPVRPVLAHEPRRLSTVIGRPLLAATVPTLRRNALRPRTATEATRSSGPTRRRRVPTPLRNVATQHPLARTRHRHVPTPLRNAATQRPLAHTRHPRVHTLRLAAAQAAVVAAAVLMAVAAAAVLMAVAAAAVLMAAVAAAAPMAAVAVRLPTHTTKSCLNTKARSAHPGRAFFVERVTG